MIIFILFALFYLAIGNPSGLISQIMNFVQLNHLSLLGQTQVTRMDSRRLHLHDNILATLTSLTLIVGGDFLATSRRQGVAANADSVILTK